MPTSSSQSYPTSFLSGRKELESLFLYSKEPSLRFALIREA